MSVISDIIVEVENKANLVSLNSLLDKIAELREQGSKKQSVNVELLLLQYVTYKKQYLRALKNSEGNNSRNYQINELKIRQERARYYYYVAKHGNEGEHVSNCTCRGCKCIAEFKQRNPE